LSRFRNGGIEAIIKCKHSKASSDCHIKADARIEAHVVALACGPVPKGYARWTLVLLKRELVLVYDDQELSTETIRRLLKRNKLQPHKNSYWCIPPKQDAAFVAAMEDVLDVYELPYDPKHPVVCMDEKPFQLLGDVVDPLPIIPGSTKKIESEYVREGTCSILVIVEPLTGRCHVDARNRRTAIDWAEFIRYVADVMYPDAELIKLVLDNLNTHTPASLYKAFPAKEAHRLRKRFEFHFTPIRGSWLDIAEILINAMTRQCLDRRLSDLETVRTELQVWEQERNDAEKRVNWTFRTDQARVKLRSLYPETVYDENMNRKDSENAET